MPGTDWLALARVERSRGRHGEVLAASFCGGPDKFLGRTVMLVGPAGTRPARIENAWLHDGRLVLKFEGVDSIDDAEGLRGFEVCIPASERDAPAKGEYYLADLAGCDVLDQASGRRLGVVEEFQETGGPLLMRVRGAGDRELLVPFVHAICKVIDPAARRIVVELPEGLESLNEP